MQTTVRQQLIFNAEKNLKKIIFRTWLIFDWMRSLKQVKTTWQMRSVCPARNGTRRNFLSVTYSLETRFYEKGNSSYPSHIPHNNSSLGKEQTLTLQPRILGTNNQFWLKEIVFLVSLSFLLVFSSMTEEREICKS